MGRHRQPYGRHHALFYLDNLRGPAKRFRSLGNQLSLAERDRWVTPSPQHNNFVKGAPGEPVLISLTDAQTLFHEFGHALHSMLQNVRYRGLAVTPRDYVELPSQLNERWLLSREVLDRFARHYTTGQRIPSALVDSIEQSAKFNQGYVTMEYLGPAIVDLELHMRPDGVDDIAAFERTALAPLGGMPREVAMRHWLPHFGHLFGNDSYAAGDYSYLGSDVMAADAWIVCQAGGPWTKRERSAAHENPVEANRRPRRAYRVSARRDRSAGAAHDRGFTAVTVYAQRRGATPLARHRAASDAARGL